MPARQPDSNLTLTLWFEQISEQVVSVLSASSDQQAAACHFTAEERLCCVQLFDSGADIESIVVDPERLLRSLYSTQNQHATYLQSLQRPRRRISFTSPTSSLVR